MRVRFSSVFLGGLVLILSLAFLPDGNAFSGPLPQEESAAPQEEDRTAQEKPGTKTPPMPQMTTGQRKDESPLAAKIDDIAAHRRGTMDYVLKYDDRVVIDMANVDFDSDVLAVVNGETIDQTMLKGYLVLFAGGLDIERFITAKLTEIGKDARAEEGIDPSEYIVSDERVEKEIKRQIDFQKQQRKENMPDIDPETWKENIDATYGWDRYRELIRSFVSFEKVFLPEIEAKPQEEDASGETAAAEGAAEGEGAAEESLEPDPVDPNLPIGTDANGVEVNIFMPIITWNAMSMNERERGLRDHINGMYKEGTPIGDFLRPHFARSIKEALLRAYDVQFFYSGRLEPGVFASVEDKKIMLDDIYSVISHRVTSEDRELALREILICKAMDGVLKDSNFFLTDEQFEKAFRDHEKQYEGSIFPLEFIIRLRGYYNKNRYKNIYRRRAGFEQMIASELTDNEILTKYYEGPARLLYENGSVKVQIIFFGTYDTKEKKYREDGWEWAQSQMKEALAALDAGEDFEAVSKRYEDPTGTFTTFNFEFLNRNHLRMALADSPKSALISGYSLADYIFYCADTNEVIGPVAKHWSDMGNPVHKGLYLVKVVEFRRSQYLKPFEQSAEMAKTDYADLKFVWWAQECLRKADIDLTPKKEG
ncbi:MAG: hypothetical protein ACYTG7_00315 [Planctomycetota bacterium]|jgi:hypothetical protein